MRSSVIFGVPVRALYSRELYEDVARHWRGLSFLYLVYLLGICWIPFVVSMYRNCADLVASDAKAVIGQIPSITITNGQVSTDVTEPYFIRSAGDKPFVMIIDTTGEITSLNEEDAQVLLTRDRVIVKKSERETRAYELSGIQNLSVDQDRVRGWLRVLATWGPIVVYPFAIIGSLIYRILQAIFYSLFGLVLARTMRVSLGYGGILSVTVVAMTPAILLKTLLDTVGISFPFRWVVFFGLSIAFVGFGLSALREHNEAVVASSR